MKGELKMPFGKHKGVPISEIETGYLKWLGTIELREPLRSAVQLALARKRVQAPAAPGRVNGTPAARTSTEGPPAAGTRAPLRQETAKPKRAWLPRPEGENLRQYYTPQGADDIPW